MASTDLLGLARSRMRLRETAERARSLTVSPYRRETMRQTPENPQKSAENSVSWPVSHETEGETSPNTIRLIVSRQSHTDETNESTSQPFVDDPAERAAIQAEAMPVRRIRKRMMSWARADDEPQPGDYCGCCKGSLWWTETETPKGWRCHWCHPPVHLPPGAFRVVAT
jgi:hypothetical protein